MSIAFEPMGVRIRRQRLRKGLTLDELAAATAISKPYLSLIEVGRAPPPSDEKLTRIEQALGFGPGELVLEAHLIRTPDDVRAVLSTLLMHRVGPSAVVVEPTGAARPLTGSAESIRLTPDNSRDAACLSAALRQFMRSTGIDVIPDVALAVADGGQP